MSGAGEDRTISSDEHRHCRIARALFDAFETGALDRAADLLAPDFRGFQNGGEPLDAAALLRFTAAVRDRVPYFRYEEIVCRATANGFVEEHVVRGTLPGGAQLAIFACVVGEIRGEQIVELREYLDARAAAGLVAALSPG